MYSYEEVINKIENSRRFGNLPGIEVTRRALRLLGEPMQGLDYIHVAGTNGKGSVCAFLSSILRRSGLKTGLFTSPHLMNFEERITVDGIQIPRPDVTRLGNRLLSMDFGAAPTMFDYCLLMAILYFREQGCDAAVIETGLGGRLDSTNALGTPAVTVITKIGMDHTAFLGDTLPAIAIEKAGIIKPGSSVFIAPQESPEVNTVFQNKCTLCGCPSPVFVTDRDIHNIEDVPLRMLGSYQKQNAAVARLAGKEFLTCKELPVPVSMDGNALEIICRDGLSAAIWPGRMQILSENPFLLVDGAHNPQGVSALMESLQTLYPNEKFHFIMGVMADKDYISMAQSISRLALDVVTVTPESGRALQAEQLADVLRTQGIVTSHAQSLPLLLDSLPTDAKNIAFGSLYFIGEILKKIA